MKKSNKFIIGIIVVCLLFNMVSCQNSQSSLQTGDIEIWSVHNTQKIMKQSYDYEKLPARIVINMGKGEYESAQLVFQSTKNVAEYQVAVNDLVNVDDSSKVIKKENIAIFAEKYIHTTTATTSKFFPGDYVDALVPFENFANKKENKMTKDNQYAIMFTVKSDLSVMAGDYASTVKLTFDGLEFEVPMTVKIWNVDVPLSTTIQSSYLLSNDAIRSGEVDGSIQMREKYYDFFLDYRINGNYIGDRESIDAFKAFLIKNHEDVRCSSIDMPTFTKYNIDEQIEDLDYDKFADYLKMIALISTNETNYFDKIIYNIGIIDEATAGGNLTQIKQARMVINGVKATKEKVCMQLRNEGVINQTNDKILKGLMDTPVVFTSQLYDGFENANCWCPEFQYLDTDSDRAKYDEFVNGGGELWWYGCVGPQNPFPTYHIDDNLLPIRVMHWMMYDYGIKGDLYWDAALHVQTKLSYTNLERVPINPYEEPVRFLSTKQGALLSNGDGYLVYPGVNYGIYGPVPSIRLMAIRDGREDYEVNKLFEKTFDECAKFYGVNNEDVTGKNMLQTYYEKLYNGVIASIDSGIFDDVKRDLYQMTDYAQSDLKFIYENVYQEKNIVKGSFYCAKNANVKINGKSATGTLTQNGQGKRYEYAVTLNDNKNYLSVEAELNGRTYSISKYLAGKFQYLNTFDKSEDVQDRFTVTGKNSDVKFKLEDDNGTASIFMEKSGANYLEYAGGALSLIDFSEIDTLHISIKSDVATTLQVYYFTSLKTMAYNGPEVKLAVGWNDVYLDISKLGFSKNCIMKRLRFSFNNLVGDINLEVDNIFVNKG